LRPGSKSAATLWGFAEATVFFIVPDVLLSGFALFSLRKALTACLFAAIGATCGGVLVATFTQSMPENAYTVINAVPGISPATFERAQHLLAGGLFTGLLTGAFSGLPYKVLAYEATVSGSPVWQLALLTPLARLPRFLLVSVAVAWVSHLIRFRLTAKSKMGLFLAGWLVFYGFYFSMVGW